MHYNHFFRSVKRLQRLDFLIKKRLLKPRQIIILLLFGLLSACVSQPYRSLPGAPELAQIENWFLKARVAITTKEESLSANLEWRQQREDFDFHIYGMFGATYTHLIQSSDKATLKLPEDQIFYHQNAQQLMRENLGWDFPIDALKYWIKGLPSGKSGERLQRDDEGRIASVTFRDWQIGFTRYQSFSGYHMPKLLKAKHPQIELRIAVKKWQFE